MSLACATRPDGRVVELSGAPPFPAADLVQLVGVDFDLPCEDPWILESTDPERAYLDGAATAWVDYPEWMDFLEVGSPCYALKRAERDLYLHWWRHWLVRARRVLDVGCGIGRFTMPLLDRGAEVVGVDADLLSLRRCAWHAAGRAGRLDLHWSTVHHLPEVDDLDVILACEVLCYVPRAEEAVRALAERLRPGGALLASVEARWGWAAATDAPQALGEALDGSGVVDAPGDRWVRTFEESELGDLLEDAGLGVHRLIATHYLTDGPLERCLPDDVDLAMLLDAEDRCRAHPVWSPLNRAWTAVAIKD